MDIAIIGAGNVGGGLAAAARSAAHGSAAPIDRLDLQAELARWSGVRTAGQIVPEPAGP